MSAMPDVIVDHVPTNCESCGENLAVAPIAKGSSVARSSTPPSRSSSRPSTARCARRVTCGTVSSGPFPKEATAPACYGPNIRAAALYLLHAQHIPVERTAEALSAMLGANVSTGFVASLANRRQAGSTASSTRSAHA